MALSQTSWSASKKDLEASFSLLPRISFIDEMVRAERNYVEDGVRRALGFWVSELEPQLMFRVGETRPFGVTAKGHGTPYIEIKWDENFHPVKHTHAA